jgi:integrase
MPKQNLTQLGLKSLTKRPGRHADGGGLYFRVIAKDKCYFVFRFRIAGREREMSLGPWPELTLEEARIKHAALRKTVKVDKIDPLAGKRSKGVPVGPSGVPSFGAMALKHIEAHEGSWKSAKHSRQWNATLRTHAAALWDMPVSEIGTENILQVLQPIWSTVPETAARTRARIEAVLASAQVDGWIEEGRSNPARWKNWLDRKLPNPRKVGKPRGHHAAMPYDQLPGFMMRLSASDNAAAKPLMIAILCALRTNETLGAVWSEIDFDKAVWAVPEERMKMKKPHSVPLSDQAVAIFRDLYEARGANLYIFAGRPQRPLSSMSMAMLLRRMGVTGATVHGMRAAFRSWAADQGVEFSVAEAALAHTTGGNVAAYQRSDLLARRRPVMEAWANHCCGKTSDNVIPLRPHAAQ